ncbi:MAG: type IV secretory system conjugative DNA transfer family protein [Candidatus Velthaea sp.]
MKSTTYATRTYTQADPINGWMRAVGLGVMLAFVAAWLATEYVAYHFNFQRALGAPLAPHIYAPWDGLMWETRFRAVADPRVRSVLAQYWLFSGIGLGVALLIAIVVGARFSSKTKRGTDAHGSAHWASRDEIEQTGLLGKTDGVYVGAWQDPRGTVHYLRDDGPAHVLAFAPTRSGKGVGLVLPTLLSWPHSVVVHDIKGENYALTGGWRERDLGSRILKFEATSIDGSSARYNPLAEVRLRTLYEVQDVQNIVNMLVDPDGKGAEGDDAHWIVSAAAMLSGIVLHVLYAETDKSLGAVANLISSPLFESTAQMFEYMLNTVHDPDGTCGWVDASGYPTQTHPVVAMAARDMLNKSPEEGGSILSTAIRFLTLFRDPIVAANVAVSDFSVRDLMHDDRPLSLYLVIPPSDMDRLKPLTRLIFNQILRALTSEMKFEGGRSVAGYKHKLLLMIDELPSLGKLEILQTALAYMAGYGIKSYLITQDVAQLQAAYGGPNSTETIMANCHVQVAYAPNKLETMELLSKLAGQATVRTEQRSYSGGRLGFRGNVQISVAETERPLLTPDEARRLPPDDALVFVAGHAPIYGRKIKYYEDAVFSERAKVALPAAPAQEAA